LHPEPQGWLGRSDASLRTQYQSEGIGDVQKSG
jgi:hypothetical protein